MIETSADVTLPVTPEEAFAVVADIEHADWLPAVRRLRHIGGAIGWGWGAIRGRGRSRRKASARRAGVHRADAAEAHGADPRGRFGSHPRSQHSQGGRRLHSGDVGTVFGDRASLCGCCGARLAGRGAQGDGSSLRAARRTLRSQERQRQERGRVTKSELADLEILEAKVRSLPALTESATARLLAEVRTHGRGPALDELVEHQLAAILQLAEARGGKGVEVGDLTQEGTIAGVVAVLEYAGRDGPASGLDRFVSRLVASHLDDTVELAAIERASDEAFVRDTEIYEAAEIRIRHELGRNPTVLELAAELGWPEERVAIVGDMLNEARARYDSEIVEYLDDVDEE